jgi:serine/threonine protein kinase
MKIGDKIRGYSLIEYKGKGNNGEVWLAKKAKNLYALKFSSGENIDKSIFDKEVEMLRKAKGHINILTIHESFEIESKEEEKKYVIVTDYAEGGSLEDKQFSSDEALQIIIQVIKAVAHLHTLNIVHRDIKADNIILKKQNTAILADFGSARDLDFTQSIKIEGTPNYLSPELAIAANALRNNKLKTPYVRTFHDDLWAVAITFYHILTKQFPTKILDENAKRLPLPEGFPKDLIDFFNKTFHKTRSKRFKSSTEMAECLINIQQERVIQQRINIVTKELEEKYKQKLNEQAVLFEDERKQTAILREKNDTRPNQITYLEIELTKKEELEVLYLEEIATLEKKNEALSNQVGYLQGQLAKKNSEITRLEKEIESYKKEVSDLKKENDALQKNLGEKDAEIRKLKEALEKLCSELVEQKEANKKLTAQLAERDEKIKQLTETLFWFFAFVDEQRIKIEQQEKLIIKKEAEISSLKNVINSLKLELKAKEAKILELDEQLVKTEQYLKSKIESLEKSIVAVISQAKETISEVIKHRHRGRELLIRQLTQEATEQYEDAKKRIHGRYFAQQVDEEITSYLLEFQQKISVNGRVLGHLPDDVDFDDVDFDVGGFY